LHSEELPHDKVNASFQAVREQGCSDPAYSKNKDNQLKDQKEGSHNNSEVHPWVHAIEED